MRQIDKAKNANMEGGVGEVKNRQLMKQSERTLCVHHMSKSEWRREIESSMVVNARESIHECFFSSDIHHEGRRLAYSSSSLESPREGDTIPDLAEDALKSSGQPLRRTLASNFLLKVPQSTLG